MVEILVYHPKQADHYGRLLTGRVGDATLRICATEDQVLEHLPNAEILLGAVTFPAQHLPKAVKLRWIQAMGAGVERFTLGSQVPPGVRLTRVRGTFGSKISEYVAAQILAVGQGIRRIYDQQNKRVWEPFVPSLVAGKTAGVAGLGNVGLAVATKLANLGLVVHGLDSVTSRCPCAAHEYTMDQLHEFLAGLDFLVLCLPLTVETQGFMGPREFACMKSSAYLINVARAGLVDREAFVNALRSGQIRGATIDVFWEEPLGPDSELWTLPGLTITPHLSGPSVPEEIVEAFLGNLERYRAGQALLDEVDLRRGY